MVCASVRGLAGRRRLASIGMAAVLGLLGSGSAQAQDQDASELAKKIQNPIGSVISLPFESNFNFKNGKDDSVQYVMNIQPVVPLSISTGWNLISRAIVPIISHPPGVTKLPVVPIITDVSDRTWGLGDTNFSFFFSPKSEGKLVWGVGPVAVVPTATDDQLGSDKWSAGPTAVGVYKTGPWLGGLLVGQFWSFAGDSDRDSVSVFYIQPFLNYNLPRGWYLSTSPLMSANWEAKSGQKWTVPLGAGFGRVFKLGRQNINSRLTAFYNTERPDNTANWTLQFTLQFLFPK